MNIPTAINTINLKALIKNPLVLNMLIVGGLTFGIKILSFFKEAMVASNFGLSELLDTYYIAILIPSFIQNVFIGALKNLFIPNYITELNTSKNKGAFQSIVCISILIISIVFTLAALIFSFLLMEKVFPGHSPEYYDLIRLQLNLVLPCLLFWGFSGFLTGLLEIENKYFIATIGQIFLPITVIFSLIFFKDIFGDLVLAFSLLLGSLIGLMFHLIVSIHYKLIKLGPIVINKNIKSMLSQYPPKVTSGLLTGINPFVDQFFAAQLVVGSITAINYGTKIPAFVVGILMLAIGNVLLPHFAKQINIDLEKAFKQLFKTLKIVFFSSSLVVLLMFIFSKEITELLFERNEFTPQDTSIVAVLQKIALVYVPFFLCTLVCVNFLTAINKNKFMAWVSFWNLILNLIMNIILVKKYGVYGLLLSTTIVYIISSFIYVGFSIREHQLRFKSQ